MLDEVVVNDAPCYGAAHLCTNTIVIEKSGKGTSKEVLEQTFWHEAVHFILHRLGFEDLNDNEQFVDLIGQALYQVQGSWVDRKKTKKK